MTEQEWEEATDPAPMLEFIRDKAGERKLQLFGVACCLRIRHLLEHERGQAVLKVVETHVDGVVDDETLNVASMRAYDHARQMAIDVTEYSQECVDAARAVAALVRLDPYEYDNILPIGPEFVSEYAAAAIADVAVPERWEDDNMERWVVPHAGERSVHCGLLRDIFGNIFRSVAVDPSWLTSTVIALAEGIYNEKAFDRLPILADALMDAGCANTDLLSHLRSNGPHVKGCWALDLLLGKS